MAEKLGAASKKAAAATNGIEASVLQSLVSKANGIQAGLAEKQGDMGSHIKRAEDTYGVNRKAFKAVCTLARMDESKRSDYLRALDDYREKLNLNPHPDMFDEGGDEAKRREAQEKDPAEENTKALKGGIKQLEAVH